MPPQMYSDEDAVQATTITGLAVGQVVYGGPGGIVGQKSTFGFDATNDRLYVGLDDSLSEMVVSKSKAGVLTSRLWNQNNTVTADSVLDIMVGGTSAGDPVLHWRVVGGSDWILGIDNSDSDTLKLATDNNDPGTGTVIVFTSAGLTFPEGKNITAGTVTGTKIGTSTTEKIAFFNANPIVKPTVSGSRGGNAALASLMTAVANLGLATDSTSA